MLLKLWRTTRGGHFLFAVKGLGCTVAQCSPRWCLFFFLFCFSVHRLQVFVCWYLSGPSVGGECWWYLFFLILYIGCKLSFCRYTHGDGRRRPLFMEFVASFINVVHSWFFFPLLYICQGGGRDTHHNCGGVAGGLPWCWGGGHPAPMYIVPL